MPIEHHPTAAFIVAAHTQSSPLCVRSTSEISFLFNDTSNCLSNRHAVKSSAVPSTAEWAVHGNFSSRRWLTTLSISVCRDLAAADNAPSKFHSNYDLMGCLSSQSYRYYYSSLCCVSLWLIIMLLFSFFFTRCVLLFVIVVFSPKISIPLRQVKCEMRKMNMIFCLFRL